MPKVERAVFFDVDGVLIDSLPQHLAICRDKAVEFGLKIKIPAANDFRTLVSKGTKISPMLYFFLAVGFPLEFAERAVADYQREFMRRYQPKTFPAVNEVLSDLRREGFTLGLITSNIRTNVVPALGSAINYFDPRCLFFFDQFPEPKSKSWCLTQGASILRVEPQQITYVGDQPADAQAAEEAGTKFLAVTYGWGILGDDNQYSSANSVLEIRDRLIESRIQPMI